MKQHRFVAFLVLVAAASVACHAVAYESTPHTALLLASIGWTLAGAGAVAGLAAGLDRVAPDFQMSWTLLLAGSCSWLLGQLGWDGYVVAGATPPVPSIADAGWVLFAVFATAGVFRFARPVGRARVVVRLDAIAVVLASTAIIVSVFHSELVHAGVPRSVKAISLAYPILYCGFAVVLAETLARYPSLLRTPSIALILLGAAIEAFAFVWWSGELFDATYVPGHSVADLLFTVGLLSVGAGGFVAARQNLPVQPAEQVLRHRSPMPAIAFAALVATLVANAVAERPLAARLPIHAALFAVGAALFARAWTMSRLWDETLARERAARAELERTNRELEAFSYSASHDLKAPLVSIQGFAASLRRRSEEALDERSLLYLDRIESNAVSLQALIDELLEFARRGRDGAQGAPIDADAIARDVVRAFRERHAGRGANVELVTPLPPVHAHPIRFRQALTNLVENALNHAGVDAPRVQIAGFTDNGTVSIVVEDDGYGVADGDAGRIFELFGRGNREGAGTGIGLALVKRVAESSGGTIRYEPGPRGGSRFVLSLPRGTASPPASIRTHHPERTLT